jgi:hypothetical protein
MITSWDIYWITRLDNINGILIIGGTLCLIFITVVLFAAGDIRHDQIWHYKKAIITNIIISTIALLLGLMTPTTKEFAAIYLIPKIANNEQMQKIPDNAAKLLNAKMEQWIDDTLAEKKKEKE